MGDEKIEKVKFKYTVDNPQSPPSPTLAAYMKKENIDKKMSLDDAKKWFDGLREALRPYEKRAPKYGRR